MNRNRVLISKSSLLSCVFCLAVVLSPLASPVGAQLPAGQVPAPPHEPAAPTAATSSSPAGADFLVSTATDSDSDGTAAANPDDDQYLIVWGGFFENLHGQILDSQGIPVGSSFLISQTAVEPAVSYSPGSHEYMVVWRDMRDGGIYGQRISAAGELLDNPSTPLHETSPDVNFVICSTEGLLANPKIAYNTLADEYLIIWSYNDPDSSTNDIYAKRVDSDGYLLNNPGTVADEHDPSVSFPITIQVGNQNAPDLVFNSDDEQYLVAWDDTRTSSTQPSDLYGQRLDADGDLLDNPATSEDESLIGVNFLISDRSESAYYTSLAYNSYVHEYLAVWYVGWGYGEDEDIYAQRLSRFGTLLDNPATAPDESDPQVNYALLVGTEAQIMPNVVYNPDRREYMLSWLSGETPDPEEHTMYGMRLDALLQPKTPERFAVSPPHIGLYVLFLVYNRASGQYLFGWEGQQEGWYNFLLRVQRVWWPGLLLGSETIVWAAEDDQEHPTLAFNSRDQETLVVWSDLRAEESLIYVQRYNRDGLPVAAPISLDEGSQDLTHPAVAYSSNDNCYLLAWEASDNRRIEAQFLSAQGTAIRAPITISSGASNTRFSPAVAYISDSQDDSFMVVFEVSDTPGASAIYAVRVFPDGTTSARMPVHTFGLPQHPQVSYSQTANRLLVVFDYTNEVGGNMDVLGLTLEPDGTKGAYLLIQEADNQAYPALTWNSDDNQFLVVWHDYRDSGTKGADVYGQRFDSTGEEVGDEIPVSTAGGVSFQQYPQVVYAADQDAYRVVWQDDRDGLTGWDIRANWVSRTGTVLHSFDDPLVHLTGWQLYPALAYIPSYKKALVAWQDGRNTEDYDIYASFGAADALPPTARFTRDPIWGQVGDTFTLNAWPSQDETTPRGGLLVRWDFNNDGTWDTDLGIDKYITRTVMTAGTYPIKLGVWDRSFNYSTIVRPIVVAEAASLAPQAVPPSAVLTIDPLLAPAGATFSFDGSASTGTGVLKARWDWDNDGEFEPSEFSSDLTATHMFTQTGIHTVRMEIRQDGGLGLSQAMTHNLLVTPSALDSLEILPSGVRMVPGERLGWRVRGLDLYDNLLLHPPVTWIVLNAQAGVISADGVFTASAHSGSYPDVIQASLSGKTDTASLGIFYPYKAFLPAIRR